MTTNYSHDMAPVTLTVSYKNITLMYKFENYNITRYQNRKELTVHFKNVAEISIQCKEHVTFYNGAKWFCPREARKCQLLNKKREQSKSNMCLRSFERFQTQFTC